LDKMKSEILDLKHQVAESLILPARQSIEELQEELKKLDLDKLDLQLHLPSPPMLKAEEETLPADRRLWQTPPNPISDLEA